MLAEMIATSSALGVTDFVIAGLDPAIHGAATLLGCAGQARA
jgi:hypothetical protein